MYTQFYLSWHALKTVVRIDHEIINFYLHSYIFLDSDWWRNLFHFLMKQKKKNQAAFSLKTI